MTERVDWVVQHPLKQAEAAEILMALRPRVSAVVNENSGTFTIDARVEMRSHVGKPVRLAIGYRQTGSHAT